MPHKRAPDGVSAPPHALLNTHIFIAQHTHHIKSFGALFLTNTDLCFKNKDTPDNEITS